MSLRLHPKHGVNPTVSQCIVCGGDRNELVLLGAAYKEEAPMKMITTIEPCDECKKKYLKDGVLLVEAEQTTGPRGKTQNHPTGTLSVIRDEAFRRIFDVPVPKDKICYVEIGVLQMIGAVQEEGGEQK